MTGRYVARLYANRRRAIERKVPFWLPGEASGQDGRGAGQDKFAAKPLKTNPGQDGQDGQDGLTATGEKETHADAHAHAVPSRSACDVSPYGHQKCPDHPDHPDQASNGAGFSWSGHTARVLTVLTKTPSWTDDRAWCARLGAAGVVASRRVVLREWVEATGGWCDATAVYVPEALPNGLALATLKAHARALGLNVRSDPTPACIHAKGARPQRAWVS